MYDIYLIKEVFNMKKNRPSLMTLLVSSALMMACAGQASSASNSVNSSSAVSSSESSTNPISTSVSSGNNYGGDNGPDSSNPLDNSEPSSAVPSSSNIDSSIPSISSSDISSSISNSGTSQPIVIDNSLDGQISQFLDDLGITIPSLNEYHLSHTVIYYYAYDSYMIVAQGDDLNGDVETAYLNKIEKESDLTSNNDDFWYTVDDYGYLYSDEDGYISINFYTSEDLFCFTLMRNDGEAGTLDVSDVDTSWYVDYVNFYGMSMVTAIPLKTVKEVFELDASFNIPDLGANEYVVTFEEAYSQGGYSYPDTFYLVLEGDQVVDVVSILKQAGFNAALEENVGTTYDEDWNEVEYTYYTGYAYDLNQTVYISIYHDNSDNTIVTLNRFFDLFTNQKTTNTDWTDQEKALMNETLHQILPFMAFGDNYDLYDDSDEDWDVLMLVDSYYEDLTEDYAALLLEEGFVKSYDSHYGTFYKYDNGAAYIEILLYYELGNFLEIYFEPSKLPTLKSLELNETSLDVIAGSSYQLVASYNPSNATHPLTWSSSNEDIATVNNKGLVAINETAAADTSVVITASASNGVSASCTFNVKANAVTDAKFDKDSYAVIPGGDKVQTSYFLLPYGATSSEATTYSVDPDNVGVYVDNDGKVYADANAATGSEATLTVNVGGVSATAKVTVAASSITHTLNREFFGIVKENYSKYLDYKKTTEDGATYEAACAGTNGIQIRSKNDPSGVIGHFEGRTCKSITFTFDSHTYDEKTIEIYASNSPFSIEDMYSSSVTKVGSVVYKQSDETTKVQTYTFTDKYSYIGFRSGKDAIYLTSVDVVW